MKTIFLTVWLSIFFITTVFGAESRENIFMKANKFYYEHAFKEALTLYNSLSHKSSGIWENMGNCAYYLDDYSYALVYWRKAQRQADVGRYTILQERIEQAYNQLHIENQENWYEVIQSFICVYTQSWPYWFLPILFLMSWTLLVLFGVHFYKNNMRFVMTIVVGITCLTGILYGIQHQYKQRKIGIVISSHTSLHTGTDEKLPVVAHLKQGQEMKVADIELGWYQASVGQYTGWVHKDMIEIV